MPHKSIDAGSLYTIVGGVALGLIVSLGMIWYEDRAVSARRAAGALMLTTAVNSVWLIVALVEYRLGVGLTLAGTLVIAALGGYSILRLASKLAEAAATKKAGAVVGLTDQEVKDALPARRRTRRSPASEEGADS